MAQSLPPAPRGLLKPILANFLFLVLGLFFVEGEKRLSNSFNKISRFKKEDQEKILIATLDFAKTFNMKHKNFLSEILLQYYREKASQVYNILHDQVSLALIVKEKTQELKRMMESREKWARTMSKN